MFVDMGVEKVVRVVCVCQRRCGISTSAKLHITVVERMGNGEY